MIKVNVPTTGWTRENISQDSNRMIFSLPEVAVKVPVKINGTKAIATVCIQEALDGEIEITQIVAAYLDEDGEEDVPSVELKASNFELVWK